MEDTGILVFLTYSILRDAFSESAVNMSRLLGCVLDSRYCIASLGVDAALSGNPPWDLDMMFCFGNSSPHGLNIFLHVGPSLKDGVLLVFSVTHMVSPMVGAMCGENMWSLSWTMNQSAYPINVEFEDFSLILSSPIAKLGLGLLLTFVLADTGLDLVISMFHTTVPRLVRVCACRWHMMLKGGLRNDRLVRLEHPATPEFGTS